MPEKEGIETIMDLRREFPEVKIIAVSGGGRYSLMVKIETNYTCHLNSLHPLILTFFGSPFKSLLLGGS